MLLHTLFTLLIFFPFRFNSYATFGQKGVVFEKTATLKDRIELSTNILARLSENGSTDGHPVFPAPVSVLGSVVTGEKSFTWWPVLTLLLDRLVVLYLPSRSIWQLFVQRCPHHEYILRTEKHVREKIFWKSGLSCSCTLRLWFGTTAPFVWRTRFAVFKERISCWSRSLASCVSVKTSLSYGIQLSSFSAWVHQVFRHFLQSKVLCRSARLFNSDSNKLSGRERAPEDSAGDDGGGLRFCFERKHLDLTKGLPKPPQGLCVSAECV